MSGMDHEDRLEGILDKDISIADRGWMVIGRQIQTDFGSIIDLLAIDADGNLVVLELKRNKTPREVIAQAGALETIALVPGEAATVASG